MQMGCYSHNLTNQSASFRKAEVRLVELTDAGRWAFILRVNCTSPSSAYDNRALTFVLCRRENGRQRTKGQIDDNVHGSKVR